MFRVRLFWYIARGRLPPGNSFFLLPTKERTKENCRCFDAADPRPRGSTPLGTPKRRSQRARAKRKQYYFSFLTPAPPCSVLELGCCGVASVGPQLSAAKLGSEQCLPLRGKQPHERVCAANWRRSLCAAKRPRTPAKVNDCCFRDDLHFTSLPCRGRAYPAHSLAITAHLSFAS